MVLRLRRCLSFPLLGLHARRGVLVGDGVKRLLLYVGALYAALAFLMVGDMLVYRIAYSDPVWAILGWLKIEW